MSVLNMSNKEAIARCMLLESSLEDILPAGKAAKEVRELRTPASDDYSDALLGKNCYGGDTAEIYLYRFAPDGSPQPSDREAYETLMGDAGKKAQYEKACHENWLADIGRLNEVVGKYDGEIQIDEKPLDTFLEELQASGEMLTHRVHVQIRVPGQQELGKVRQIKAYLEGLGR